MKTREYQYDNIRFLLMALAVLGHLLEIAGEFPHRELLYALIYSFHMPAFLFLSGMFARFDRTKWLFGMALLAGFDKRIDYQWSASRIIAFQPWFLLGYYFRRAEGLRERWKGAGRTFRGTILGLAALCCVGLEWLLLRQGVTAKMMLGAYGYEDLGYRWQTRGLIMCCAACVIFLMFVGLAPRLKGRIPVITALGQNTLPIYLLHGFFFHLFRLNTSGWWPRRGRCCCSCWAIRLWAAVPTFCWAEDGTACFRHGLPAGEVLRPGEKYDILSCNCNTILRKTIDSIERRNLNVPSDHNCSGFWRPVQPAHRSPCP